MRPSWTHLLSLFESRAFLNEQEIYPQFYQRGIKGGFVGLPGFLFQKTGTTLENYWRIE